MAGQDDLNRFLAEIDRLRKKSDGGDNPQPARPKPKAKIIAKPVSPPPKRRIGDDVPVVTPPVVPVATPVAAPQEFVVTAAPTLAVAPQIVKVAAEPQANQAAKVVNRGKAPRSGSIAEMLSSKQSIAAAMALQTVLGPPLSRAPRR
jgi:hypothetical protein